MKTMIAALAGLLIFAGGVNAAPITYNMDFSFEGTRYYCVPCGGTSSPVQTPGGTVDGTITFDSDLVGINRLVAYEFTTTIPQFDPNSGFAKYAPKQSFTFDYNSNSPKMDVSLTGDTFKIHNMSQMEAPPSRNPPINFDLGWNTFFVLTLDGPLGGPTLEATIGEGLHLQSILTFSPYYYRWFARNDGRASNGNTSVTLSNVVAPVPLPAGLPLLAAGLGGMGVIMRRRKAA